MLLQDLTPKQLALVLASMASVAIMIILSTWN